MYKRQSLYNLKKRAIIFLHDISLRMCKYQAAGEFCLAISAIKSNKSCAVIKAGVRGALLRLKNATARTIFNNFKEKATYYANVGILQSY